MSLLEEILSGIKRESPTGDVPPSLKRIVSSSMTKQRTRRRAILLSAFAFIMVGVGYGVILLFETVPSHLAGQNDSRKVLQALQGLKTESFQTQSAQQAATNRPPQSPPLPHSSASQQSPYERDLTTGSAIAADRGILARSPGMVGDRVTNPSDVGPGGHRGGKEMNARESGQFGQFQASARLPGTVSGQQQSVRAEPIPAVKAEKDLHLYTAKTYEAGGDYGKALIEYQKALELDNNNYLVLNNIAGVLIRLGLFEEATVYAEKSIVVKKDHVPSLINLAVAQLKSGESEVGMKWLLRALQLAPTDKAALSNLALLHEKTGEYAKSYDLYRRLAATDDMDGHLGMARVCEKESRAKEAEAIYRNILKRDPDKRTKKLVSDRLAALGSVSDSTR